MKFQRNLRIFRGQLDAAPIACVLFLLLFFVMLQSSLVYRPGLRVGLAEEKSSNPNASEQIVRIDGKDRIFYKNATLKDTDFQKRLREESAKSKAPRLLTIRTEPGTKTELVQAIKLLGTELSIPVQVQKYGIELPEGDDLPGTDYAHVVVAISHDQRFFLQNQQIQEEDLPSELATIRAKIQRPLTLVLDADKSVTHGVVMKLAQLARRTGFDEVLLAVRPKVSPLPGKPAAP